MLQWQVRGLPRVPVSKHSVWQCLRSDGLDPLLVAWELPPHGSVKIKFDDSRDGLMQGHGFLILDGAAKMSTAGGGPCEELRTVNAAERRGLWVGLKAPPILSHFGAVHIQGDSLVFIDHLTFGRSVTDPIHLDILMQLASEVEVGVISHACFLPGMPIVLPRLVGGQMALSDFIIDNLEKTNFFI